MSLKRDNAEGNTGIHVDGTESYHTAAPAGLHGGRHLSGGRDSPGGGGRVTGSL